MTLIAVSLVVGAIGAWFFIGGAGQGGGESVLRASLVFPEEVPMQLTSDSRNMAISPDGKRMLYQGPLSTSAMYVRHLDRDEFRRIEGSEGFLTATFSPDGNQVAFFTWDSAENQDTTQPLRVKLVKVPLDGGLSVELATVIGKPNGLSWGPDGTIVYATGAERGLWVLPPDAGASPTLIGGEYGLYYLWPHFLPDGKTVVANAGKWEGNDDKNIVAISIESGEQSGAAPDGPPDGMATPAVMSSWSCVRSALKPVAVW